MAKLIALNENGPSRDYDIPRMGTIGRHPSQTIQILDRLVSKEHAIIEQRPGGYVLRDLGSRNGTFVNNRRIGDEVLLCHGDKILLGSTRLVYVEQSDDQRSTSMARVTINPRVIQSSVLGKLVHTDTHEFQPENSILNDNDLRQDYEKLRMAYKLQRDVALEVDLDRLLQKIMDSLFELLRCDRGAILLMGNAGTLEPRYVKNREGSSTDPDELIHISHTIVDQVVREKAAVLSSDASMDDRFSGSQSIIVQGIRSTMCVPLISRERVLGVIHLDTLFATGAFTERDLNVVQGLATQAAIAIENSMLVSQRENDARLREKFSRLLSPNLVDQLVEGKLEISKGGSARNVTVLFSDLRGFTSMSQRLEPQEIVHMLNEYFEFMVDIVFEFDGTLDKFMGDGIMAIWGSPVELENAPLMAVKAAIKMREALAEFNELRRGEGLEEMRMGIGIDSGELIAGYMGSTKTMSYTVIGPPVNLASRLCGAAKANEILISNRTLKLMAGDVRAEQLHPIQLKGISEPVTPYNVLELGS